VQDEEQCDADGKHQQGKPDNDPCGQNTGLWVSATPAERGMAANLLSARLAAAKQLGFHFISLLGASADRS